MIHKLHNIVFNCVDTAVKNNHLAVLSTDSMKRTIFTGLRNKSSVCRNKSIHCVCMRCSNKKKCCCGSDDVSSDDWLGGNKQRGARITLHYPNDRERRWSGDLRSMLSFSLALATRYPRWILWIIATGSRSRILSSRSRSRIRVFREITSCSRALVSLNALSRGAPVYSKLTGGEKRDAGR